MSSFRPVALAATLSLAAAAFPAAAGASQVLTSDLAPGVTARLFTPVTQTLTVDRAVRRDCLDGRHTGAGTTSTRFLAPADGQLTAQLRGTGTRDDWDLAAFAADGTRLEGSGAFFANEVLTVALRKGQTITLQACRRSGRDSTMPLRTTFVGSTVTATAPAGTLQQVDVRVISRAAFAKLESLEATGLIDVTHDVQNGRAVVLARGTKGLDALRGSGLVFTVTNDDVLATDRRYRAADRAYTKRVGAAGSPLPSGRSEYRYIEDYYSELKALAEGNPDLVRAVAPKGKTAQGRDIPVVEIAADVATPADGRPYFSLIGLHHAREWPSAETTLEFAIDLVKSYKAGDPRVTALLKSTRILVQPMTNMDGFNNSRTTSDIYDNPTTGIAPGPGGQAYRRKNCNFPFPAVVPCELQTGVDNNRNYTQFWGGPGASASPQSETYRGPSAGSEPEGAEVRELVSDYQVTSLLTIHNVAALVLRPPGLEAAGLAPDEPGLKSLGDKMGKATGYTSQYGWELYDTTGTTEDWSYAATGGYGYTIEIGPVNGDFHMPYETGVVDEYFGTDKYKGKGLREAYLLAAEHATNVKANSRLVGRAPAGRVLRLKKSFNTQSYDVCAAAQLTPVSGGDTQPDYCGPQTGVVETPDTLESTMTVPASGRFTYWMNPSTRPFEKQAGKTETWTLTCEDAGKVVETHALKIDRGEVVTMDLPCGGTLVEDAKPAAAAKPKKRKSALQKCLDKAAKKKSKSARAKAKKACRKKHAARKR